MQIIHPRMRSDVAVLAPSRQLSIVPSISNYALDSTTCGTNRLSSRFDHPVIGAAAVSPEFSGYNCSLCAREGRSRQTSVRSLHRFRPNESENRQIFNAHVEQILAYVTATGSVPGHNFALDAIPSSPKEPSFAIAQNSACKNFYWILWINFLPSSAAYHPENSKD